MVSAVRWCPRGFTVFFFIFRQNGSRLSAILIVLGHVDLLQEHYCFPKSVLFGKAFVKNVCFCFISVTTLSCIKREGIKGIFCYYKKI